MSSPPVDPWSGQPEHDPTYGVPPTWPTEWHTPDGNPAHHQGPTTTPHQPGAAPAPPAGPYPTLPYDGPAAPPGPYVGYPTTRESHPTRHESYPGLHESYPAQHESYPAQHDSYGGQHGGYPGQHDSYSGYPPSPYQTAAPVGGPAPQRRPINLTLALSIIGVLAVLLGGGSLAYLALPDDPNPDDGRIDASVTPTASASVGPTPDVTPSATEDPAEEIRLVAPDTLAGRPRSRDKKLQKLADDMVREMKSKLSNDTGVVGAFYGSPEDRDMVMVVAASAFVLSPTSELDDAVEGITDDLSVTRMTTIAPGPLGGVAKCGDGKSADVSLGICAWADHGSVGIVLTFFSSAAAAAAEFGTIRAAVELRD
ncbi:hypothetical protein O7606_10575 [Micromonospora sp. WMMD882]|uniref:hypothetical protein n=1 Tax=Micromonospora sp. WMMD882 TaxID=3015151 RepID=UPI00248AE4AD|nr:hypothetical protein [Micromonospora sp. WMMD882]WBB81760.1 hypothetical protein O7606_10575 [Micromonospora sp. WMMD882]